jgi:hypothetical protein
MHKRTEMSWQKIKFFSALVGDERRSIFMAVDFEGSPDG